MEVGISFRSIKYRTGKVITGEEAKVMKILGGYEERNY